MDLFPQHRTQPNTKNVHKNIWQVETQSVSVMYTWLYFITSASYRNNSLYKSGIHGEEIMSLNIQHTKYGLNWRIYRSGNKTTCINTIPFFQSANCPKTHCTKEGTKHNSSRTKNNQIEKDFNTDPFSFLLFGDFLLLLIKRNKGLGYAVCNRLNKALHENLSVLCSDHVCMLNMKLQPAAS